MRNRTKADRGRITDTIVLPASLVTMASDWLQLVDPQRPNGLIVGPREVTAAVLDVLEPLLHPPVVRWPRDGAPWNDWRIPATLVLQDVMALGVEDQLSLFAWIQQSPRPMQVISFSTTPVFAHVEAGEFLSALYYRLNTVYVECV